jgi:hypothetical protein
MSREYDTERLVMAVGSVRRLRPGSARLPFIRLLFAALLVAVPLAVVLPASPAAAAQSANCSDRVFNPQNVDWCYVRTSDYNVAYVAELTAAEVDCSSSSWTYFSIRVRIVGDYEAVGDKFHVRQFSVRYLSGTKPWIYFQVHVTDGNGVAVDRDWNAYGNWITYDGAGQYVDNTMNLYPPASYSPVFGTHYDPRRITFRINGRESDGPSFPYANYCTTGSVYVQLVKSVLG